MRLDKIIARSRVVDLRSHDLEGALQELLAVSVESFPDLKPESLLSVDSSMVSSMEGSGVSWPIFSAIR